MVKGPFACCLIFTTYKQLQLVLYREIIREGLKTGEHVDLHNEILFKKMIIIFLRMHKTGQCQTSSTPNGYLGCRLLPPLVWRVSTLKTFAPGLLTFFTSPGVLEHLEQHLDTQ